MAAIPGIGAGRRGLRRARRLLYHAVRDAVPDRRGAGKGARASGFAARIPVGARHSAPPPAPGARRGGAAQRGGADIVIRGGATPPPPPPARVTEKQKEAAARPRPPRFPPPKGTRGLRRPRAPYYARRFGVKLNHNTQIVATLGSK